MSRADDDSGMFELKFEDERYLPFEDAGVITFPAQRSQLKGTGSASVTISEQQLPFFARNHSAISSEAVIERRKGQIPMISPDRATELAPSAPTLGSPFTISSSNPQAVEELALVVNDAVSG
jgi:hypothetical protein